MKKLFVMALLLAQTSVSLAQAKVQLRGNVYTSTKSDSAKQSDVKTGRFYEDKKGNLWPVYISKNGKLYALRTSAKGKVYKFYIKPDTIDSAGE